jgi:hypothetical protein
MANRGAARATRPYSMNARAFRAGSSYPVMMIHINYKRSDSAANLRDPTSRAMNTRSTRVLDRHARRSNGLQAIVNRLNPAAGDSRDSRK